MSKKKRLEEQKIKESLKDTSTNLLLELYNHNYKAKKSKRKDVISEYLAVALMCFFGIGTFPFLGLGSLIIAGVANLMLIIGIINDTVSFRYLKKYDKLYTEEYARRVEEEKGGRTANVTKSKSLQKAQNDDLQNDKIEDKKVKTNKLINKIQGKPLFNQDDLLSD